MAVKVKGLSLARSGANTFKASWDISNDNKKKLSSILVERSYDEVGKKAKDETWPNEYKGSWKKKHTLTFGRDKGYHYLDRSKFYPNTKKKLNSVRVGVTCYYKSGKETKKGKREVESYEFDPPKSPSSVTLSLSENGSTLTATITVPEGHNRFDRYDTAVQWYYRYGTGSTRGAWKKRGDLVRNTGTKFTSTCDMSATPSASINANKLTEAQWIEVKCEAYCRGLAGASGKKTASRVLAQPATPSFRSPAVTLTERQVLVAINTNNSTTTWTKKVQQKQGKKTVTKTVTDEKLNFHPVSKVQLYRYIGTSLSKNTADWTEVEGSYDDGNCTALHDARADAEPTETGQHVWYMVKATHDSWSAWSDPVECEALYKEADTSTGSKAKVLSAVSQGDGETALVRVGWQNDTAQTYDTTVLSWSTDRNAWKSTDEPSTKEMRDVVWKAGTVTVDGVLYNYADIYVRELDDGETWYFSAHRTSTANDQEGAWCDPVPCTISSVPAVPVLSVPGVVQRNSGFTVTWSAQAQTAWKLWCLNANIDGSTGAAVIAQGDGSTSSWDVPAPTNADKRLLDLDAAQLAIEVSTGGDYTRSATAYVAFAEVPTVAIETERTVTAANHAVKLALTPTGATASLRLLAQGCTAALPDGSDDQPRGDVVWSETGIEPGDDGTVELAIPDTAHLIDGAEYLLEVTPYNGGLAGDTASPRFETGDTEVAPDGSTVACTASTLAVDWAHQAAAPSACTVSIDDETGAATITPAPPDDAAATDTFAVYRNTPDGPQAIGAGYAFGESCIDPVPPFSMDGTCEYLVATFTADGDCDWDVFEYGNYGTALCINWGRRSVELPYNLKVSDSFSKSFEGRTFLDQSKQGGTWAPGIERTVSVDSTVIRDDEQTASDLRNLAQYAGACFARFPDGRAFECDCQVSSIEHQPGQTVSVSLDLTETELVEYLADGRG